MQLIAGRYELRRLLGEGGMARVHLARDQVLDRRIALKVLRRDIGQDEVLRERFLREAKLAARLTHENIVRVYDTGIDDGMPWMAMEVVEGRSLRQEMSETGQMPVGRCMEVVEQVLAGLGAAHAAGIVHRDVKPSNVLIGDRVQLSDFGIAKSLQGGGDLTQTNQFLGTPKYTAPEVAMGYPATPQSDVYSAAVVLWEMLAGEPPFDHDNALALAMMHRTDELPPLAERRPDLPAALVAAVEAGLAKEATDRPDDAAGFTALLHAGLKGDTIALAAATAPTAAIPRVAMSDPAIAADPDPHEATMAMPRPESASSGGGPPGASPAPSPRGRPPERRNVPGLVLLVVLLIVAAAVAYNALTAAGEGTGDEPEPTPTATVTPSVTPSAEVSQPAATQAPPAAQPTVPVDEPATTPQEPAPPPPEPEPIDPPVADPEQPPEPQPTADPPAPATPEPLEPPPATPDPVTAPG